MSQNESTNGYYMDGGTFVQPEQSHFHQKEIDRKTPVSNIINIETRAILSLAVTLYNVDSEKDVNILLESGKSYSIKYLTENGIKECSGKLTKISSQIPLKPVRYIGEHNEVTDFAYICIDCSTENNSDIRKIFIRSIRDIASI